MSRQPLVMAELKLPDSLEPGQVLVKLHCSGICGSQIGEIDGAKGPDRFLPHLLGHEGTGTVIEVGGGVRHVAPGNLVVLHWRKGSYTRGLLASVPRVPRAGDGAPGDDPPGAKPLSEIPGTVPPLWGLPSGCAFAPRCALATERCRRETPPLERKRSGHWAACWAVEPGTDNGRAD